MKKSIFSLMLLMTFQLIAQTPKANSVFFYLKTKKLFPQKITLISYAPGESGNGTNGYILIPGIKKKLVFPVGTKLYLANSQQIGVVMSGKRIDADNPFWVVKTTDINKVVYTE